MFQFNRVAVSRFVLFVNTLLILFFTTHNINAQPFTPGSLVVLKVGDGTGLTSAAQPISVLEYSTSGVASGVNIVLPSSGSGPRITNSGTATSEGQMTLSAERDRLILVGYDANAGTTGVVTSASSAVNRQMFAITPAATYSLAASTATLYNGNNIRSGTASGSNYFGGGPGSGISLMNAGFSLMTTPVVNTRVVQIFNGQIYFSSATGANLGVLSLGTNITTACCAASTLLNASPSPSAYGFSLSPDGNTLYIADDAQGINKYTKSGATYALAYNVNSTLVRSIAVDYSSVNPIIYATTASSITPNQIIKVTDAGMSSTSTVLVAASPANTVFRSISFTPSCQASITLLSLPSVCVGSTAKVVIKGNPTGVVSYNVNGGATQTTTIDARGYDTVNIGPLTGNTTINLVSINTPACTAAPVTGSVSVNVFPTFSVTAVSNDGPLCAGNDLHLGASISASVSPYTYVWSGPAGAVSSLGSTASLTSSVTVTTIPTLPTFPAYSLAVTDATGCAAYATTTTTVNARPVSYSVFGSGSYCSGGAGVDVQLSNSESGVNYQLYNSSGTVGVAIAGTTGAPLDFGVQPAGIYTISAINSTSGCSNSMSGSAAITMNPLPAAITGNVPLCVSSVIPLTDASGGGTWSSGNSSLALLSSGTGIVTGVSAGNPLVTYTLPTGCFITAVLTVNPTPLPISGPGGVCITSTISLSDGTGSGSWYSSNTGVATIVGGLVSPVSLGTTTISYVVPTGCMANRIITVNPLPAAITGSMNVCVGLTTTLTDGGGGTWSTAGASFGSIDAVTGILTGITAGTASVTYTLPTGCTINNIVTVNPLPLSINGGLNVCAGYTTTLNELTSGGSWSSGNVSIASVGSGNGIVSGITAGNTNITYTLLTTGCYTSTSFTVNPLPSMISGPANVCAGSLTTYSDASGGGTWASSNTGIATIGSGSGVLSAIMAGTTTLTYTIGTGCTITTTITVNPLPAAINGSGRVCEGLSTSFSDITPLGNWISGLPASASVDAVGNVTGLVSGTVVISYQLPTGCYTTSVLTVDPLPGAIAGPSGMCAGSSTVLTDVATGGSWSSSNPSFVSVNSVSGLISAIMAGSSTVTYTLPTGCLVTMGVTVNPLPPAITGSVAVCAGASFPLTNAAAGGTWSSSNTSFADVGSGSGIVTGTGGGSPVITYTLPTSCYTTAVVTINGLPSVISGSTVVCLGAISSLSSAPAGGVWSSSAPSSVSIGSATGIISANLTGAATITYTLGTGCKTTTEVTVNPLAPGITGTTIVCPGATITLSNVVPGGTWSSTAVSVATVGSVSGIVSGMSAGAAVISYLPPSGCGNYITVTVSPLPATISGNRSLCPGSANNLSDATPGGNWSSSDASIATIIPATGDVTGVAIGTAIITYTLPTGCFITGTVTVNPLPASITGWARLCAGATTSLSNLSAGGTWTSSAPGTFTVSSLSGIVTGVSAGTAFVTYSLNTGCIATALVTVDPLPAAILGTRAICQGLTSSFTDVNTGGAWISALPLTASIDAVTGIVTGIATGTATISYTLPTSCAITAVVTVNPLPNPVTGNTPLCVGAVVTLSDAGGGSWSTMTPAVATVGGAGNVLGIAAGTAIVSYTLPTGCGTTTIVTVNPLPSAISGASDVCIGLNTMLTDLSPAGYWSSGNVAVAVVDAANGIVTGVSAGSVNITYSFLATGCSVVKTETVVPLPPAISGPASWCVGNTVSLSDPSPGGIWSTSDLNISISPSGSVTGLSAGTANVTYTIPAGCASIKNVTVNPLPPAIAGIKFICAGANTTLSDAAPGGTWSSGVLSVASISGSGLLSAFSAGTSIVSYTLPTGCATATLVTVNPLPATIGGQLAICTGVTSTLSDLSPGGLWSVDPLVAGIAVIDPINGSVSALAAGTVGVSYTLPTGCFVNTILTVDPIPLTITGTTSICVGTTSALSNVTIGGVWSSSNSSLASVGSLTGVVSAITDGTAIISYRIPTGCFTTLPFIVNPLPASITGNRSVCLGASSLLSDASAGGTWSISGSPVIATIGVSSGLASGVSLGTSVVTYTLPTGCSINSLLTVNPFPAAISGDTIPVCQGFNIFLSDSTPSGIWSSANPEIAGVVAGTGVVNGTAAGTVSISYTLPTGCGVVAVVTVNPLFPISGSRTVCTGSAISLSDLAGGGTWTSSNSSVATIGSISGLVAGLASGATLISYHLNTGCTAIAAITVNAIPAAFNVAGGGAICAGAPGVPITLDGSFPAVNYELFNGSAYAGTQPGSGASVSFGPFATAGFYTVRATDAVTGCVAEMTGSAIITVNPNIAPVVSVSVDPGLVVCEGTTVSFIANAINGGASPSYQWLVNGISVATGAGYSYIPLNSDSVSVVLTSSASCVLPATSSAGVVMNTVAGVVPSLNISASPGDSLCPGTPVTLTPTPMFGGFTPAYRWIKNGIYVGTGSNYTYLPVDGDNVFCELHSSLSCSLVDTVYSNNINMHVPPISIPIVSLSAFPGLVIAAGQADTLVADVVFSGLSHSYQWTINGVLIPGANSDTFISNTFNNLDTVKCIVTGNSTCGSTERISQVIILETKALALTGIENSLDEIRLLPNPNNGTFVIKGQVSAIEEISVEITDMLGQNVYSKVARVQNGWVNEDIKLGGLANGMYLLTLKSGGANKVVHFSISQ